MSERTSSPNFRWLTAIPLVVVIALSAITLTEAPGGDGVVREKLFDLYQRLKPRPAAPAKAVFVDIDQESLNRYGAWPWPRTRIAALVRATAEAGALSVAIETPLEGADPFSPEQIRRIWFDAQMNAADLDALSRLPEHDDVLAASLDRGHTVMPLNIATMGDKNASVPPAQAKFKGQTASALGLPKASALTPPATALLNSSASLGVRAIPEDHDGVVRGAPLIWSVDGAAYPSLGLEAARRATGGGDFGLVTDRASQWAFSAPLSQIQWNSRVTATDPDGKLRFWFKKDWRPKRVEAWRILTGAAGKTALRGSIAVIGAGLAPHAELVKTARGDLPLAAAHTLAVDQILNQVALTRPAWATPSEAAAALLLGVLAVFAAQRFAPPALAGALAGVAVVGFVGSWLAFSNGGLLLNPLPMAVATLAGAMSVVFGRVWGEYSDQNSVKDAFNDALPAAAVSALAHRPNAPELTKGARRPLSIMACELRIADEMRERFSKSPEAYGKLLRNANAHLHQHILKNGGAVEPTDGGRLLGFWNAPLSDENHAQSACACALSLIESMDDLNADLEEAADIAGHPFAPIHIGVGVATGECFVGPIGAGQRSRYAAWGEPVDFASHLRGRTKLYGPAIIVDQATYDAAHHRFAFLEVDLVQLKPTDQKVHLHALLGNPFIKASPRYRSVDDAQREILSAYRSGDFELASELIVRGRELKGANPALFDLYSDRIKRYGPLGGIDGWNGAEPLSV